MKKIMIVDDQEMKRFIVKAQLESTKYEFDIYEANDGKEALEGFDEFQPDLIVSDLNMPRINGVELYKEIIHIRLSNIPIIIFTSCQSDDLLVKEIITLGATHIFKGSFESKVFIESVKELLNLK